MAGIDSTSVLTSPIVPANGAVLDPGPPVIDGNPPTCGQCTIVPNSATINAKMGPSRINPSSIEGNVSDLTDIFCDQAITDFRCGIGNGHTISPLRSILCDYTGHNPNVGSSRCINTTPV
jgi:hypothetical protein